MKLEMFEIVGRCLFWREKKVLVVGDLHLGYEEVLNEQGMVFPKSQLSDYLEEFGKIFGKTGELNEIVLLGDIKHHFGGILRDESDGFYKLIEFFENNLDKNGKIVITEGNHDNILAPIVRRFDNVELKEGHLIENVLFFHGYRKFFEKNSKYFNKIDNKKDKIELNKVKKELNGNKTELNGKNVELNENKVDLIVIGHFHPAVVLEDGVKKEKYKCFLHGKMKEIGKNAIIVPSFVNFSPGTDVLTWKNMKLEGKYNISNFNVVAVDENWGVYSLGKVKSLEKG